MISRGACAPHMYHDAFSCPGSVPIHFFQFIVLTHRHLECPSCYGALRVYFFVGGSRLRHRGVPLNIFN